MADADFPLVYLTQWGDGSPVLPRPLKAILIAALVMAQGCLGLAVGSVSPGETVLECGMMSANCSCCPAQACPCDARPAQAPSQSNLPATPAAAPLVVKYFPGSPVLRIAWQPALEMETGVAAHRHEFVQRHSPPPLALHGALLI